MRKKTNRLTAYLNDEAAEQLEALTKEAKNKTEAVEKAIRYNVLYNYNNLVGQYNIYLKLQHIYAVQELKYAGSAGEKFSTISLLLDLTLKEIHVARKEQTE